MKACLSAAVVMETCDKSCICSISLTQRLVFRLAWSRSRHGSVWWRRFWFTLCCLGVEPSKLQQSEKSESAGKAPGKRRKVILNNWEEDGWEEPTCLEKSSSINVFSRVFIHVLTWHAGTLQDQNADSILLETFQPTIIAGRPSSNWSETKSNY